MVKLKEVLKDFGKIDAFVMVTDIFGVPISAIGTAFYRAEGIRQAIAEADSSVLSIGVIGIQPHKIKIDGIIDTVAYIITINTEIED